LEIKEMHCRRDHGSTGATPYQISGLVSHAKDKFRRKNEDANMVDIIGISKSDIGGMRKVPANKRDVPYQSLIKTWLAEKIGMDRRRPG
jgi:hypothetical protein